VTFAEPFFIPDQLYSTSAWLTHVKIIKMRNKSFDTLSKSLIEMDWNYGDVTAGDVTYYDFAVLSRVSRCMSPLT